MLVHGRVPSSLCHCGPQGGVSFGGQTQAWGMGKVGRRQEGGVLDGKVWEASGQTGGDL